MSKELIEKLKKLVENVEKISKGGPGSGPRPGQKNREGTGSGVAEHNNRNEFDSKGPSNPANNNKTTLDQMSRSLNPANMKAAYGNLGPTQLKAWAEVGESGFINQTLKNMAFNILQANSPKGKYISNSERNKQFKQLKGDKNITDRIRSSYPEFKNIINSQIKTNN